MPPNDDGEELHAVTAARSGDGRIEVAAWSPPPSSRPSAHLGLRAIDHGVVAVLAAAPEAGLDAADAVSLLAGGADLSVVAEALWSSPAGARPLGVVTARIEEGIVRLAVAGTAIAARLDVGRRRVGLAGGSVERDVRAITTGLDDDATIVIQAGSAEIPATPVVDASARCDHYAAQLLDRLGWTGHAVLVAGSASDRR